MDPLTNPVNMAAMRAAPVVPIKLDEFNVQAHPEHGEATLCHLYYTPASASNEPTPPPSPPRLKALSMLSNWLPEARLAMQNPSIEVLPTPEFINTHGRSTGLDSPPVLSFTRGFARVRPVLNFQNTSDSLSSHAATFRALLNTYPSVDILGGRSKGARAAARAQIYTHVKTLIFFTYTLHRGMELRIDELLALDADTDVLFIVGEEDALCVEILLQGVRKRMRAKSWWIRVVGGTHRMVFGSEEMGEEVCGVVGQIAARCRERTELRLRWDYDANQTTWTEWAALDVQGPQKEISSSEILESVLPVLRG